MRYSCQVLHASNVILAVLKVDFEVVHVVGERFDGGRFAFSTSDARLARLFARLIPPPKEKVRNSADNEQKKKHAEGRESGSSLLKAGADSQ
jgi:hypothetical protein